MRQEKRGFLAGLKERFNRSSKDGTGEGLNGLAGQENLKGKIVNSKGRNVEAAVINNDEFIDKYGTLRSPKELNKEFANTCKTFVGGKYLLGGTTPSNEGGEGIDCSELPLIALRRVAGQEVEDMTAHGVLTSPNLVIAGQGGIGSLNGFNWRTEKYPNGDGRFDHITVNVGANTEVHPSSVSETIRLIKAGSLEQFAATIINKEFNWRYILGKNNF